MTATTVTGDDHVHDWKEVYYGHECSCGAFYAHGAAPWDDFDDRDDDEWYWEPGDDD